MSRHCETCRFFDEYEESPGRGLCRRHAPKTNEYGKTLWATVEYGDWCGEHRPCPSEDEA